MTITLLDLTLSFIALAGGILLWQNFKVRELALSHAKAYCSAHDLQLLDDAVFGIRWRPTLHRGQPKISRRFRFYFTTTGEQRYSGKLDMVGLQKIQISADPHRLN